MRPLFEVLVCFGQFPSGADLLTIGRLLSTIREAWSGPSLRVSSQNVVTMRAARPILLLIFLFNVLVGATLHQSFCVHGSGASTVARPHSSTDLPLAAVQSSRRPEKCADPACLFHRHEDERSTNLPLPDPNSDGDGPTHHRTKCSICQSLLQSALLTHGNGVDQLDHAEQLRLLEQLRYYRPETLLAFSTRGPPIVVF